MEGHHAFHNHTHNHTAHVHTTFSPAVPTILIPVSALLAIAFGSWLWYRVSAIKVGNGSHGLRTENGREYLLEEEQRGEDEVCDCSGRATFTLGLRHAYNNTFC